MRDARALAPEPALDAVSAQLGEMLRRADALLAEWSAFGDEVRARVAGEVSAIGQIVGAAIDRAALDMTTTHVERQFAEQLGTRLAALGAELARLEGRARAASRAAIDAKRGDRHVLWLGVAGIAIANVLLAVLLLRSPPTPIAPPLPQIQPAIVAPPPDAAVDAPPPPPPVDAAPPAKHPVR